MNIIPKKYGQTHIDARQYSGCFSEGSTKVRCVNKTMRPMIKAKPNFDKITQPLQYVSSVQI